MEEIFTTIAAHIEAHIPDIRWVDFDLGQLQLTPPPVAYPCILIGFPDATYQPIGPRNSTGTVTIEVVLAFHVWERTHNVAPAQDRSNALKHLRVVATVRQALTNLEDNTFTKLIHTNISQDKAAHPRVWRLRYTTEHYPAAAAAQYQPINTLTTIPTTIMPMPDIVDTL